MVFDFSYDLGFALEGVCSLDSIAKGSQEVVHRPSYIKHVCNSRYFLYLLHRKENSKRFSERIQSKNLN